MIEQVESLLKLQGGTLGAIQIGPQAVRKGGHHPTDRRVRGSVQQLPVR